MKSSPCPLRSQLGISKYMDFHHINENVHLAPVGNLFRHLARAFSGCGCLCGGEHHRQGGGLVRFDTGALSLEIRNLAAYARTVWSGKKLDSVITRDERSSAVVVAVIIYWNVPSSVSHSRLHCVGDVVGKGVGLSVSA
jgi:hypothetical protein